VFFLDKKNEFPRRSFTVMTLILAAAALVLPVLRAKWFIFSPSLMLCYALVISLWLMGNHILSDRKRRIARVGLVVLGFFLVAIALQNYLGGQSHVYSLIISKIVHLGQLPSDSTRLPFETKVMWTSSFNTPTFQGALKLLSGSLLGWALLFRPIVRFFKGKGNQPEIFLCFFVMSTFVLYILVDRLMVFFVFFLILPVGQIALIKNRWLKIDALVIAGLCLIHPMITLFSIRSDPILPNRPPHRLVMDVIDYIKTNTAPDDPILSVFELGPSLAAYTERPTVLHSSFESKPIRDKVQEIYTALFGSEDEFYQVCRKYDTAFFIYQSNMVLSTKPGGFRYKVDVNELERNSAAALFHYNPLRLKNFQLVHENELYGIFRVNQGPPSPTDNRREQQEEQLWQTLQSYLAQMASDNPADHRSALENIFPTVAEVQMLFPQNQQQVWSLTEYLQLRAFAQIEQIAAEETQGGNLIYISLHDIRRESYEDYKNALALIPSDVAVYGAVIYRQYRDTDKSSFVYVNNRWVWLADFISLPELLK